MTTDFIRIYQSILEEQGIQFLLLNDIFSDLEKFDFGFRKALFEDFDYSIVSNFIKKEFRQDTILMLHDRFDLDYCLFKLPEDYQEKYSAIYGMIGPVTFEPITPTELEHVMKEFSIPESYFDLCMELNSKVPVLPSHDFWQSLLRPLLKEMFGESASYHIAEYTDSVKKNYSDIVSMDPSSLEHLQHRYYIEDQLLDAVAKGDRERAVEWYCKFSSNNPLPKSIDAVRHQKNIMLTLNTLLQRAVHTAGIHPYYIEKVYYQQCMTIEHASTVKELEEMPIPLIRKYCMLVHNHNYRSYSAPVERCIQYIEFYYAQPLTLDHLAQQCYVSSNYLSSLFKKEIGVTLKEYINQVRIRQSILLLNTTHLSIQEVAGRCGFPDANYFSRIFKKMNGITPLSYRKAINK